MRTYRGFAYVVALAVVVQAALIAFAVFGLGHWIENDGGVADNQTFHDEHHPDFTGASGFDLHGELGGLFIPILALLFLITAVVVRKSVPGGVKWAAIVFGLVVVQSELGFASHDVPWLGPLHGLNAFALFTAALHAAKRPAVRATAAPSANDPEPVAT